MFRTAHMHKPLYWVCFIITVTLGVLKLTGIGGSTNINKMSDLTLFWIQFIELDWSPLFNKRNNTKHKLVDLVTNLYCFRNRIIKYQGYFLFQVFWFSVFPDIFCVTKLAPPIEIQPHQKSSRFENSISTCKS